MGEIFSVDHGLATLGPELVEVRTLLEAKFLRSAAEIGASPMLFPALMRVKDLDGFDYFRNFPHLVVLASRIQTDRLADYAKTPLVTSVPSTHLNEAEYVLPSAACYNIYLHLKDSVLPEARYITTVASCYRNEKEYVGLRRLWNFSMREIVCVGGHEAVQAHVTSFKKKIQDFASRLGLQLAIASLNFHRNFFGERCRIKTGDGKPAFTGCVAFGIERWLHALLDRFKNDTSAIASALRGC